MAENDRAQNLTIGAGSSAEGLVNDMTGNLNGVNFNDNPEQRPPQSNLEELTESKMELTTPTEPIASRTSEMNSSWMKNNSSDAGFTSAGIIQTNTSSEKTYIVGEKEVSKEVNPKEYDIAEEEKNSKEANMKKYDSTGKKNAFIEPKILIGRDIYKEFEGVKSHGTVLNYITTLKLFEVLYENDGRMEYLNHNDVLSHLTDKDKIYEVQLVEPPSNILEKISETEMEDVALEEQVTSKKKKKESSIIEGKSSRKKRRTSSGPSSRKACNIKQAEITPQPKESAKRKKKENSKSASKVAKKEPETKSRPWHAMRENATEEEPYEPHQFMGLYVCKKVNGIRSLATVVGYCSERNKLKIKYKTDNSIEYLTQLETLSSMAKREDILASPSASGSKKKSNNIEKASTSGTKKRTTSGGPKV